MKQAFAMTNANGIQQQQQQQQQLLQPNQSHRQDQQLIETTTTAHENVQFSQQQQPPQPPTHQSQQPNHHLHHQHQQHHPPPLPQHHHNHNHSQQNQHYQSQNSSQQFSQQQQHHHPMGPNSLQQQQQQQQKQLPNNSLVPNQQQQQNIICGQQQQQVLAANNPQPMANTTPTMNQHSQVAQMLKKELPANGKKTKGRVRIKMEFIHNKLRRYTTFSKRKTGIMKKAFELATLTGTQVMLLVASETGHVYTFATRKLQPMIISDAGKALIQTCLNSPDSDNLLMSAATAAAVGASSACSTPPTSSSQPQQQQANQSTTSSQSSSIASPLNQCNQQPQQQQQQAGDQFSKQANQHHQHRHQAASSSPPSITSQSSPGALSNSPVCPIADGACGSPANSAQAGGGHLQQSSNNSQHSSARQCTTTNSADQQQQNCGPTIQSQHNMLLAAAASNAGQQQQVAPGQQRLNNNQQQTASPANNNNNSNPTTTSASTTDQRMSATGFEEPDLSYSINDDLNDRSFANDCLPISLGTISGTNSGGTTNSRAVIVDSPQAFERTLQNQDNNMGQLLANDNNGRQQQSGRNYRQTTTTTTPIEHFGPNPGGQKQNNSRIWPQQTIARDSRMSNNMIEISSSLTNQHQSNDRVITHFNQNPLYTGLHDTNESLKTDDQLLESDLFIQQLEDESLLEDEEEEEEENDNDDDELNDIYNQFTTIDSSALHGSQLNGNQTGHQITTAGQPTMSSFSTSTPPTTNNLSRPNGYNNNSNNRQQPMLTNNRLISAGDSYQNLNSSTTTTGGGRAARNSRKTTTPQATDNSSLISMEQSQHQTTNSYQIHQFSDHHQHQQIDLSEECGGLFVEYQTNRNSLGGLEELHSLNVTNCDSETLEEQMNLLSSGDDAFGGGSVVAVGGTGGGGGAGANSHEVEDDFQDFGIGSTNDNFLNMLFSSAESQQQQPANQASRLDSFTLDQQQLHENTTEQASGFNQTPNQQLTTVVSEIVIQQVSSGNLLGKSGAGSATTQSQAVEQKQDKSTPTRTNSKTRKPNNNNKTTTVSKTTSNSKKSTKQQQHESQKSTSNNSNKKTSSSPSLLAAANANKQQDKITTTNTNKRLLPKKANLSSNQKQSVDTTTNDQANRNLIRGCKEANSWMASPVSTVNTNSNSSATLSPISNSQFDFEAPYKQQLDNLRKKLRMDLPPRQQQQQQNRLTADETNRLETISDIQLQTTTIAASGKQQMVMSNQNQQQQQNQANSCHQFVINQQQQLSPAMTTNKSQQIGTTYVLTQSLDGYEQQSLAGSTNGTIYLRTVNGLVPIVPSSNHQPTARLQPILNISTPDSNHHHHHQHQQQQQQQSQHGDHQPQFITINCGSAQSSINGLQQFLASSQGSSLVNRTNHTITTDQSATNTLVGGHHDHPNQQLTNFHAPMLANSGNPDTSNCVDQQQQLNICSRQVQIRSLSNQQQVMFATNASSDTNLIKQQQNNAAGKCLPVYDAY